MPFLPSGDAFVDERIDDVLEMIVRGGCRSKDEIREHWGFTEEQYELLRRALSGEGAVQSGSRRTGGFCPREQGSRRLPDEAEGRTHTFHSDWERHSAALLAELFSHAELEAFLGQLVYTVRRSRVEETGASRRGTKAELAAALVVRHGMDLLAQKEIRKRIARRRSTSESAVDWPRRWLPGKAAAIRFVAETGFPSELTGTPDEETRPDFEFLEGRFDLKPLRDFQREVQVGFRDVLLRTGGRGIVTLPTGAGKTRVAVDSICDWLTSAWVEQEQGLGNTVLWLAHTEELCEQAYACFKQVWQNTASACPLLLFRFWGGYTRDYGRFGEALAKLREQPAVLISTPQRIVNLVGSIQPDGQRLLDDLLATIGLTLIDEAHRAAAPMYREILKRFSTQAEMSVIGLTATPFRGLDAQAGAKELRRLFERIIEPIDTLGENPRVRLQEHGYLSRPVWETIETHVLMRSPEKIDLVVLTEDSIEKIDRALKLRADNTVRRMAILRQVLPTCRDERNQILYFGPSVLDAECMTYLLRERGVPSAFVSGSTRDATRRRVIRDFKEGHIRALCNCEVLTTGFDAPQVTHVVMARPTVSRVLYEQMIGRGLRGPRFGGTEECVIIDCEDNYPEGGRPMLGYEEFRKVWRAQRLARAPR